MLTAFDLFSEHGIKNVSMDDIAHNASISKRTLYELFEDKETLLTECINLSYTKMRLSMKRLESEPITALEVALLFYELPAPTQERGQDLYFRKIQIRLAKTDLVHRRQNNQADNQRGRFAYVAVPTRKQYGRQDARPADHMEKR